MKLAEINLNNLDDVLKMHAYEFQEATDSLPRLRRLMTEAKQEVDRTESILYLNIRKEFEASGGKFTEPKIAAEIKAHEAYADRQRDFLDAREAYDEIDQLREVYLQREGSIKALVSLYIAQYWSLSSVDVIPKAADTSKNTSGVNAAPTAADAAKNTSKFKERA